MEASVIEAITDYCQQISLNFKVYSPKQDVVCQWQSASKELLPENQSVRDSQVPGANLKLWKYVTVGRSPDSNQYIVP